MGYRYSWNRVGLRTQEERTHRNKLDQYVYDLQMRLKEAKVEIDKMNPSSFDKQLSYVLDLVDNIQRITETKDSTKKEITTAINNRNQYTRFDTLNLSYDSNGNLKQKGNQSFTYDYKNQLVKYSDSDKIVEFRYDPFGRRISKQLTANNQQLRTNYYYEGYRVIEERDSSDNLKKQYIYGTGIDELLRMDIFENGTSKPYYFHHNLIGSITGVTDNSGNIVEMVEYDPYGKPYFLKPTGNPENPYEISETSTIGNNYLFQGREYDPETGLYYFRARYYHPELRRFISEDPNGYVDSFNLSQAFLANPVNFSDPFGKKNDWEIGPFVRKEERVGRTFTGFTYPTNTRREYLEKVNYWQSEIPGWEVAPFQLSETLKRLKFSSERERFTAGLMFAPVASAFTLAGGGGVAVAVGIPLKIVQVMEIGGIISGTTGATSSVIKKEDPLAGAVVGTGSGMVTAVSGYFYPRIPEVPIGLVSAVSDVISQIIRKERVEDPLSPIFSGLIGASAPTIKGTLRDLFPAMDELTIEWISKSLTGASKVEQVVAVEELKKHLKKDSKNIEIKKKK